jgi:hypothetical protein
MSGDYSRFGFVPSHDYSAVLLQQGRALTDRDWNDSVTATSRSLQARTLDISDPVVVSAATPDAFKITSDGLGGLMIGRGRMYVDGILAENHGGGRQQWDAELAELYRPHPVPYEKQPYLPRAPSLPTSGPNLVYLDVWPREVTHIEDPDLIEKALNVDTTTRIQNVWQVKVLGNVGPNVDCSTPLDQISAWTALTKPTGGRLTTAVGQFTATDPCLIPPSGGYKGLENQLYRVQIHKAGPLGTATFKWSRDNGSVETRVTRLIGSSQLVVESVGKDDVLRFSDGDWIEIIDDWLELNGLAGELRRIKIGGGVDDATRTITLDNPPLTAGLFPTDGQGIPDPNRHTRIRRWDQAGAAGDITVPANGSQVMLENGVLVSFGMDPAGGDFRVGDYWAFAARTTDASIEILTDAPPSNIHHHYAKLAVFTPPATIEDCRPKQEDCCCSISVRPGENIQTAIKSLPPQGGCVCLKAGIHPIKRPITISRSNVKLVGECSGTIVRFAGPISDVADGIVLLIGAADSNGIEGVEVSSIVFERQRAAATWFPSPIVGVIGARRSAIEDCGLKDSVALSSIGIMAGSCEGLRIARCTIESVWAGIFAFGPNSRDLTVQDNTFNFGLEAQGKPSGAYGIFVRDLVGPCRIDGNELHGVTDGIVINDDDGNVGGLPRSLATGTIVTQNQVWLVPPPDAMFISAAGTFAIDVAADLSIVSQNVVWMLGNSAKPRTGIRVTGTDLKVIDNEIGTQGAVPIGRSLGIQIGYSVAAGGGSGRNTETSGLTIGVRASGNSVQGLPFGIFATAVSNVIIESNVIDVTALIVDRSNDGVGIILSMAHGGKVNGNVIGNATTAILSYNGTMNQITGNNVSNGSYGVNLIAETAPIVSENRIHNMSYWGVYCAGITARCDVVKNRVTYCGSGMDICGAIGAYYVFGELHVALNEVMKTGLSAADGGKSAAVAYGIWGALILEALIEGNLVTYSDFDIYSETSIRPLTGEDRALLMNGFLETRVQIPPGGGRAGGVRVAGFAIQILGNKFEGFGKSALVELTQTRINANVLARFERVVFNNNYCMHRSPNLPGGGAGPSLPPPVATVVLVGRVAIVMGNQIRALTPNYPSVNFNSMPGPYIGNVVSGPILRPAAFPLPELSFNLTNYY